VEKGQYPNPLRGRNKRQVSGSNASTGRRISRPGSHAHVSGSTSKSDREPGVQSLFYKKIKTPSPGFIMHLTFFGLVLKWLAPGLNYPSSPI